MPVLDAYLCLIEGMCDMPGLMAFLALFRVDSPTERIYYLAGSPGGRSDGRDRQPHDDGRCHEVCRQCAGAHGEDAVGCSNSASHSGVHAGRPALGRPPVREALPPPPFAAAAAPAHPARCAAGHVRGPSEASAFLCGTRDNVSSHNMLILAHCGVAGCSGCPEGLLEPELL